MEACQFNTDRLLWCITHGRYHPECNNLLFERVNKYEHYLKSIRDDVEHVAKDTPFRVCNDLAAEALKE